MERMTRKEWARVFGEDYQTLTNALHTYTIKGRRIPNQLFDGETVKSALVKYYADKRMRHLERAARLEAIITSIREKEV